jgi:cytochrome c oxidase subunit 3
MNKYKLNNVKKYNINNINYWENYLKEDVSYVKSTKHIHYYNDINYTPWPFHICICLFLFCFFSVLHLHFFEWATSALSITFISLISFIIFWSLDLHYDSVYFGKFNYKIRRSVVGGFLLFLISEAAVFAGFIWAYLDRFFHSPSQIGGTGLPIGIEFVSWDGYPLWGAFILLASGWGCNCAYYAARGGSWYMFNLWSLYGHVLGGLFIINIQLQEYFSKNTLSISDSVIGSCYYIITGFHGLHVCIGLFALTFLSSFISTFKIDRDRIFAYALALAYWHFVDWIWLFLYFILYIANSNLMHYNEFFISEITK